MIEIPGFWYDATIKNYIPILSDTAENRALNIVTASKIINHDKINTLKNQNKSSRRNLLRYVKTNYPCITGQVLNLYNINKFQQTNIHNIRNDVIFNTSKMKFSCRINLKMDDEDDLNLYHKNDKCFQPDYDSQFIMSSYSSSPFQEHHSLLKVDYTTSCDKSIVAKSDVIKRFDHLTGVKVSLDNKKMVLLSKKEFSIIDKVSLTEISTKFKRQLPLEHIAFDMSEKLLLGISSKKGLTHLAAYDLVGSDGRYETRRCDWENRYVFRDIVYDVNAANLFLSLRGRMENSKECILQQDWRCPIPSQKNIPRLSLNFHKNSNVHLTRVPNYSDLIVTNCHDGNCALWDMRWKDRPVVIYENVSSGKPDMPIDIDPSGQFVTMTDNNNVIRIFNLKTGLTLYCEKQPSFDNCDNRVFSFFSHTGLHCRPTLVSNFSPNLIQIQHLKF